MKTMVPRRTRQVAPWAELPGLEREQVEVTVENGVLTLRGEKKQEKEEGEEGKWHIWERSYGSFERSFGLPRGIDEAKVEAQFENGVLKVTVPKKAGSQGKKIPIGT